MKQIYLDNASTTAVRPEVLEAMVPYFTCEFGNPSSLYPLGQHASDAVAAARQSIASLIGATPREVYFTSGGSESDNWAIKGVARANATRGSHIVTSVIEHHAVLRSCEALEREGFEVTYVPVDAEGVVSPADFEAALRPDTVLASIMCANNEIGTIEPVAELARIAHAHDVVFHTDAVQALGHEPVDVAELGVDLLSASAHKLGGPKGVGLLYVNRNVRIARLIDGGQQERGYRASTENVAGIVGFAKALELACAELRHEGERQRALRDRLIERVCGEVPSAQLNGGMSNRLPNNANFSFDFVESEGLLLQLAMRGICASSGSACTSGSLEPSHVLLALGLSEERARGSLRLTLGRDTSADDVDFTVESLKEIIAKLRGMNPAYVASHRTGEGA